MITTYQARLQAKHDHLVKRLIDNQMRLIGNPTDCIRIRRNTDKHGDKVSSVLELADIVPIVFPPWKDVPYRRLGKDIHDKYELTSLVNAAAEDNKEKYEIYAPGKACLMVGDLIIRIMLDEDMVQPVVICIEATESLGTFGGSMIIQSKFNTTLYNDKLEDEVTEVIGQMAERRLQLKF